MAFFLYTFGGQKREEIKITHTQIVTTTLYYVRKWSLHIYVFSISDGKFGAYMQVNIQNDGPVTIELESPKGKPAGNCEPDSC